MQHRPTLEWIVDTLVAQIRRLERRAGRAAFGARIAVQDNAAEIEARLLGQMDLQDLEVVQMGTGPRVLSISFEKEDR